MCLSAASLLLATGSGCAYIKGKRGADANEMVKIAPSKTLPAAKMPSPSASGSGSTVSKMPSASLAGKPADPLPAPVAAPPAAPPAAPKAPLIPTQPKSDDLVVANASLASGTASKAGAGEPIIFSNAKMMPADAYVGALSDDIKSLMALVEKMSTAVTNKPVVVERVVEKPVEKIVERVITNTVEKKVDRIVEKPVEKIVERVITNTVEKKVDRIVEKPVDRIVEKAMTTDAMIKKLDEMLGQDIATKRSGLRPFLAKASLCLLDGDCKLREEDLATLTPEERIMVEDYRVLFTQLGERLGRGDRRADHAALVAATGSLVETLDARKSLRIGRVALCSEISGYGQFEPLAKNEFSAGELPRVLIYTELSDFKTEVQPDAQFAVKVVQEVALHKVADGKDTLVWEEHPAQVIDLSRAARRDFFLGQLLRLPKELAAGSYELRLRVLDLASGAAATASLPIKVTPGK